MLKRSRPLTCVVLVLACRCGGQVVVDHDDRSEAEMFAQLCINYCDLARMSDSEYCQQYDRCLDRCTGNFAEARAAGCVEELLAWYNCVTAVLEQGGFCDSTCHESIAYHQCTEAHEGK